MQLHGVKAAMQHMRPRQQLVFLQLQGTMPCSGIKYPSLPVCDITTSANLNMHSWPLAAVDSFKLGDGPCWCQEMVGCPSDGLGCSCQLLGVDTQCINILHCQTDSGSLRSRWVLFVILTEVQQLC